MWILALKNVISFLTAHSKKFQDQCCLGVLIPAFKNMSSILTADTNFLETFILRINKRMNFCGTKEMILLSKEIETKKQQSTSRSILVCAIKIMNDSCLNHRY
jgi:hypothetical protein